VSPPRFGVRSLVIFEYIQPNRAGQTKREIQGKKGTILVRLICVCVLILTLAVGCSQAPKSGAPSQDTNNKQVKVQQIAPQKLEIKDSKAVAAHLENLVKGIPQVESAHCVVFGNTAVVGINIKKDLDRSRVGSVKYSVAEALKKDPYGVNAIVTADMDLDQRLRNIRDNIQAGRPIQGFAEQMADIVGRVMPQLPRDIRNDPDIDNAGPNASGTNPTSSPTQ
jgi:YhcN/YlaJ family sporulation lipoprotein